jgi:hypothetical protein
MEEWSLQDRPLLGLYDICLENSDFKVPSQAATEHKFN